MSGSGDVGSQLAAASAFLSVAPCSSARHLGGWPLSSSAGGSSMAAAWHLAAGGIRGNAAMARTIGVSQTCRSASAAASCLQYDTRSGIGGWLGIHLGRRYLRAMASQRKAPHLIDSSPSASAASWYVA